MDNGLLQTRAHAGPTMRILRSNSAQYDKSVEYLGAGCWNSLTVARRSADTYAIFKNETKIYLKSTIPLILV